MSVKRKKDEKEEDRDYDPGQESFDETSEEEEETEETSDSEDDVIHDAQPLLKELTKPSKKKVSVQDSSPPLKKKKHERKKKFNTIENNDETEEKKLKKTKTDSGSGKKKSDSLFNDEIVDVNLYNEAPQNIKEKTVMLNQGLLMKCHVVDAAEMKNNYNTDFSALTYVKKIKDGKSFRFSVPLNLGPTIQNAIQVFVTANPQFFAGSKTYELVEVNNPKRN